MLDLVILALGLAVYGAVFAFVGTWLKRPLVVGLVFAFGWEQVAMALPGYVRRFTVAHYLQGLVPHALPSDNALSVLQSFFREAPGATTSVAALLGILAVFLWLATRMVTRREYVLEQ